MEAKFQMPDMSLLSLCCYLCAKLLSWFQWQFWNVSNKAKFVIHRVPNHIYDVTTFPNLANLFIVCGKKLFYIINADQLCKEEYYIGPNLQLVRLMSLLSLNYWIEIAYLLSVARNAMISAAILQHNADRLCDEEHLVFTRWPFVFLTTEGSSESEKNHIWKNNNK